LSPGNRSVRVLVDGRQVGSVYLGAVPRSDEWGERMAQSLVRAVTSQGFGGQGTVEALHATHGVQRYDADRIAGARRAARMRDGRKRATGPAVAFPASTEADGSVDDRGGE
jgi:hypothetical protein